MPHEYNKSQQDINIAKGFLVDCESVGRRFESYQAHH